MRPYDLAKPLTAERLRQVLAYDPATGIFRWLQGNNQTAAGDEAGYIENTGYVRLTIDGHRYVGHRLAWLYMTGAWPVDRIDHRDGCKANNKWDNLRAASDQDNSANKRVKSDNKLGVKGVRLHECGRYQARIQIDGRIRHLGLFSTLDEAAAAYANAATAVFGEFARVG